jgi:pyruvate dehydrogenase E2 component (dihydrolipoamide acetyltransferase)
VTEFKLPELGENIDQGDLVRLMISPGVSITAGQPVMELETDKAVVEVPSSITGVVKEIRVKEGEKIKVGQVIFTVENGAGGVARAPSPAKERNRSKGHVESVAFGSSGLPGDSRRQPRQSSKLSKIAPNVTPTFGRNLSLWSL